MCPALATERDQFLASFEREYQTTLRVLNAYPASQSELKPSPRSQTARELAWTLAMNKLVTEPILAGRLMPEGLPPAPATWAEVVAAFQQSHRDATARLARTSDADFNGSVHTIVGPRQEGDVRTGDMLWMMLSDTVHHRGQLSVYLRMAGGKVPSIYGPSGDEPWM